jgi:cathepsin B
MLSLVASSTLASSPLMHPSSESLINDDTRIAFLNQNSTWVAGRNPFFDGKSFAEVRGLFGTDLVGFAGLEGVTVGDAKYGVMDVPTSFDSRTNWPGLIAPIRDQQQCGSCWAFSAAEVLTDRNNIKNNKAMPVLSPEDLVSCDSSNMGCQGGRLPSAWKYLQNTGIVTDTCFPYTAGDGNAPTCATTCADGSEWSKTKAASSYAIRGVANMQKEIMTNGPVQVAFKVYKSFMNYKSGVYKKKPFELLPEGGHAVKIVGWGSESGEDYWLVANSWNTNWGDEGFFKISRGSDECGMETMGPPYAGTVA